MLAARLEGRKMLMQPKLRDHQPMNTGLGPE
jgi:hypothetical protein